MDRNGILKQVRRTGLGIGVLAALAVLPGTAGAATVARDATTLSFTAAGGEANQTVISSSGTDIVFTDDGAPLIDGDGAGGCVVTGVAASCPSAGLANTQVALGNLEDSIVSTGNPGALSPFTIDAGVGSDTVRGTNGADLVLGGSGADFVDGQQGTDTVLAGAGNDVMQWDPGDGSDTLEGQENRDTLRFNGSNINEITELSANGGRVLMTRNVASIVMDLNDVEVVEHNALGGADTTTVNDLSGTDVTSVVENLAALGGGGDSAADQVIANATNGVDNPLVAPGGGGARVNGLAVRTTVVNAEPASDQFTVNGLGGNDQSRAIRGVGALLRVLMDGGGDSDTFLAQGTIGADSLAAFANGTTAAVSDDGGASVVSTISEGVLLEGSAGDDSLSAIGNLAGLTSLTMDAGPDADTVSGGNGADLVLGGSGADFVDGQQGTDTVLAGAGNDVMQWDPGDGSDTLEGQENRDTLRFNGSNINEITELSANGGRVRMTRNVASIVMDLNDVEVVEHNALGGADTTTVNDLSGTDVTSVVENLAAIGGGGDSAADQVIANATNGDDTIAIKGSAAAGVDVLGLVPRVKIRNQEPSLDQLSLHTLAGADIVRTNGLAPGSIGLAID